MSEPLAHLSEDELRCHATWLQHLARRLVGDNTEAEDLAQDVWIELARGAGPVAHLKAFTARIARRLAGHRRRAARARGAREARAARAEALPGPEELEGALETQRLLFQELTALDEVHRRPLLLCFYEGLSAAEIARRSGLPPSTVRSQVQRALEALRARLDRRHGGERALWVALFARLPERTWRPEAVVTGGGVVAVLAKTLVATGAAGALFLVWRGIAERERASVAFAPVNEPPPSPAEEPRERAPQPDAGSSASRSRFLPESAGEWREPGAPSDVAVLVVDADTEEPLPEFRLEVEGEGRESESLVTDAGGRAVLAREWFEAPFQLSATGDVHWESRTSLERDLAPSERPAEGEPLVLRCATGPSYTLLFDGPTPPLAELFANLWPGASPPSDPYNRASLHQEGARIWTRFGPDYAVRSPKRDEPWTLTVFARDGLWRASGPVATISGLQAEPVLLRSAACGALEVRLQSGGGPVEGECGVGLARVENGQVVQRWHYYGLVPSGQSTVGGQLAGRGKGFRTVRFTHLEPGLYRASAGSATHEFVQREVRIAAGVVEPLVLDVTRMSGLGELRVVITSETGTLPLPIIDVRAREVATNARRWSRWLPESTTERRVLVVEGRLGVPLELTLDGLESLGSLAWSPRTSAIAQPGDELVFTCLDSGVATARRAEVRVLSSAGLPIREAGVSTYFGPQASFLHMTDAEGRAHLEPILEGMRFDVVVLADGYRPAVLRALALARDGEVFEVRLEPGWGAWLDVVLGSTDPNKESERAAGARVLVDGVEAGRLDERGQILLAGDQAPRAIEVLHPGYRIAYGDIDPTTGAPRAHANGPYWVVLEPLPR